MKQVSKSYQWQQKSFQALNDINLVIQRGEIFGIFGASGAGKSTLLRTLNLLETPSSGQVLIHDMDLTRLDRARLNRERKKIGMIFQHFNLLSARTAYENIALPLELLDMPGETIKTRVEELLSLTQLDEFRHHYPAQLSGGQQQRVAIARALATQPDILLCDEPTSALDPNSTQTVLQLLREINVKLGVTIVLITHEMEVIRQICHRAGVLERGSLIEYGPVVELFARPQSDITRKLVQKALHLELPKQIADHLSAIPEEGKSCLVRFTFVGDNSNQPLISSLVKQFDITVNIIQANIENIQNASVGFTICLLSGKQDAVFGALDYVKASPVSAEVLGYV